MASVGAMFAESGTCGDNLTWDLTDDVVTISGTGEMWDYTGSPWSHKNIKSVVLNDGVTSIGDYVFSNCSSLTSVTIPNSVTSIGYRAFDKCTNLLSITIPNSITSIGDGAFDRCENLKTVYNYSPYLYVNKGSEKNGYVGYNADEVHNIPEVYKGTYEENITWTVNTKDSTLTISGEGAMIGVSCEEDEEAVLCDLSSVVKTVIISENITSIEEEVFSGWKNIKIVYNYSPYLVVVKGSEKNGYVGYYADEVYNINMPEEYKGTCGENLIWIVNIKDSTLTISGSGVMNDYLYSSNNEDRIVPWRNLFSYIKTAIIEEGVTSLGNNAFPQSNSIYHIPQIVYNYSPTIYIRNGSGPTVEGVYYIYWAQEVHNYSAHTGTHDGNITWSFTDGVLSISGEGEMSYNTYSATPWHNYDIDTVIVNVEDFYVSDKFFPTSAQIIIGENVKRITIGLGFDKVKALSDKTSISIISELSPFNPAQYYDVDGNGEIEMMQEVSKSLNEDRLYDVNIYSTQTGTLIKDSLHAVSAHEVYKGDFSVLSYLHSNNDDKLDMVYYYGQSWNTYKLELIESEREEYVAKPIDVGDVDKLVPIDANSDGRMDFYSCEGDYNHFIHYRQPDGSYLKTKMQIITDTTGLDEETKQWMSASTYLTGSYLYVIGAGSCFVIVGDIVKSVFQYIDTAIDINNDGLIDLLSSSQGALLVNIGNNRFIPSQAPGQIIPKDLNGDGIIDYVLFDTNTNTISMHLYTDKGFEQKTLMQNASISNVWCYDFDNDGDMDILLPFDWNKTSGYAFLVFFRNDGNNTFKKIENAFDEPIRHFRFMDCKDIDNDGKYEIIATDSVIIGPTNSNPIELQKGDYYIVRYDSKFKISVDTEPFITGSLSSNYDDENYGSTNNFLLSDFNNDGKLDYWYSYGTKYSILSHFNPAKVNTAPTKMSKPKAELNEDRKMLLVSWNRGSDKECSALDLTYNLRIGTKSGEGDIWFAAANPDGSQRTILGGNAGANLSQWVNVEDWAVGDYYIAVQAVDPNNLGGAWSDELVYHHSLIPSQFEVNNYEMTTADTLLVQLGTQVNKDYTYNWNFGESAVVLSQEGQNYQIAYNTYGMKTISLQVKAKGGATSPISKRTIQVYPVRFDYVKDEHYSSYSYFDMNMDGTIDRLMSNTGGGFYRGNGDGTFTKLAKTYNADIVPEGDGAMCFIDYNMDGLPDVLRETNKGNLMLNEDDYDLTFETHDFVRQNVYGYHSSWQYESEQIIFNGDQEMTDFNSDGYLDFYYSNIYIYGEDINGEVSDKWTSLNRLHLDLNGYKYSADLNNDGLEDILLSANEYEEHVDTNGEERYYWYGYDIYLQQTDGTFRKHDHIGLSDVTSTIKDISDLSNDGYLDLIVIKDSVTLTVYLGDKDMSYTQTKDIKLSNDWKMSSGNRITAKRDLDNNGYIDLICEGGYIIYMYPDFNILCQSAPTNNLTYLFFDVDGDNVPDFNDYLMRSRITNEAPAMPKNLRMTEENGAVKLMWDAAVDKETPAAQMRYNISVKKKGAKVGEKDAFIISPMNGLRDEAAIVPGYPYKRSTQTYIPYKRFEVGQEYEFQIQAIDAWNAHSAMSAPITFTVQKNTSLAELKPIKTITLASVSGTTTFDDNISQIVVEATVTPEDATNQNLHWKVVNGSDKVTLSTDGKRCTLTLKDDADNGEILLRAEAQDGSGIYGELTLMVKKEKFYTIEFYTGDPDWYEFPEDYEKPVLLQSLQVREGELPVYTGPTPTKELDDENYMYWFSGWYAWVVVSENPLMYHRVEGIQLATANCQYYAMFDYVQRTCTVTFVDWDGEIISQQEVEYGGSATVPDDPVREGYTFVGWDGWNTNFDVVTSDIMVYAEYKENVYYTVTFVDWDGTVLKTEQVEEEHAATAPADPTRENFTFIGWDKEFSHVTSDMVITAQYQHTGPTADKTETTDINATTSEDGSVLLEWPEVEGADTYTIEISKNGEVICTLIFNSNGQLLSMRFALIARDGCSQTKAASQTDGGWQYVVTGLEAGAEYTYTMTATGSDDAILFTQTITFTMEGSQDIDFVQTATPLVRKVLIDGVVYIKRGDKLYTLQGQEVK
ncbi:MAG: VCBS repeat-containing protein [Paludibacteraceae bacterium]|nr:VCBS repeat-containing protein [Paludibacteraceae bacterium]